ncbi:hypothetical protein J2W35_003903 [Variovorax boronicumulans]|uniref:hypothetical protein n=1 Tax=Variovorax boronicumulans TaxID=436515 RepID=UPI00277EDF3F|nr:hypothetical protein [Variovorax boronicumulans]MDQ0083539.1 hypothetical protein [Variovorax boronicumulans]
MTTLDTPLLKKYINKISVRLSCGKKSHGASPQISPGTSMRTSSRRRVRTAVATSMLAGSTRRRWRCRCHCEVCTSRPHTIAPGLRVSTRKVIQKMAATVAAISGVS